MLAVKLSSCPHEGGRTLYIIEWIVTPYRPRDVEESLLHTGGAMGLILDILGMAYTKMLDQCYIKWIYAVANNKGIHQVINEQINESMQDV